MCGELRGATRQEMVDFVMGKKVAPPVLGNCVELLESPDAKPAATPYPLAHTTINNTDSSKENRRNHRPPPSLSKPASTLAKTSMNPYFKPTTSGGNNNNINDNNNNNRGAVRNPYSTGRSQQTKQPQKQKQDNDSSVIRQKQPYQAQQGPPKTTNNTNEPKEAEKPSAKHPNKQQLSFFEKTKQAKGRRKSGPPVVRVPFQKGTVEHDPQKAETYIYPKHPDFPTREYQLEITDTALNYNTLVSLPTGLGKTHIAAVVMYNYFRWFTSPRGSSFGGKIVFLAPTLPLVHQQIEACYKIMGIPGHETAVLTGKLKASERKELWKTKRVFYCTPQTVQKDIMSACGIQDSKTAASNDEPPEIDPETVTAFSRVVCLVLDEAHKATGDYSYTRVIDLLTTAIQAKFRILGLSATPGKTIQAVQDVITALKACKIEARTDSDKTVAPYLHTKRTEIVVCPRNTSQIQISKKISTILQPLLERLREEGGLQYYGNETMSSYSVLKARQTYEARMRATGQRPHGGLISCFHAAHALVTIRNDCHQQGLGVVKTKIMRLKSMPQRGMMSTIVKSDEFSETMQMVLEATGEGGLTANVMDPKLAKLCELLKHHFERENACNHSSRAIVFAQFRDAVKEIVDCLESTLKPLVRSRYFVGQNKGSGSNNKDDEKVQGMNQANQQKAIKDFRNNIFNVLVCTSIGEEGLDIGDVDLIINYDVISSPIRTIQRAGRTGRKRDGRVVSLISEGTEERTHKKRLASERTLVNALKNPKKFTMADHHPMLPNIPLKEYRTMEIKTKLSQVAGQQHTPGISKKAEAEKKRRKWRLDSSEEYERQNLCGNIVSLKKEVTWERLKGFFCKNRVDPAKLQGGRRGNRALLFLGKEDRARLLKKRNKIRKKRLENREKGRIEGVLYSIQRFGPVHFEGTTRSGYRDILSVFPVDPVEEKQKPPSVSKKLWENSNSSSNHRKNLPSSKNSEAVPVLNISIPAPKPTTESETIINGLGLGDASNPSNSGNKVVAKLTNRDSEVCQRMPTETAKLQDSSVINEPKSSALPNPVKEATVFRLATPPPSSEDDSSAASDNEENDGFRLPTQSSSSESDSEEADERKVVNRKPMPINVAQIEVLNPYENEMISANDKSSTLSHETSFEKDSRQKHPDTRDHLENPPEKTTDELVFRFPTPPPSSSSCSSGEEGNDDSDTITVFEVKPIGGFSSENPDTRDAKLHACDIQDLPTSSQFSPSNEHTDSIIMNLEDSKFKPAGIVSIHDGRTPKQKVSIGFDDENDVALSSLKSRSRSKERTLEEVNNPNDDSDEDVALISFSNKKKTKSNSSRKKLEDDYPLVTMNDKKRNKTIASGNESVERETPAGVSFGKNTWKDKSGVDDSEDDTPLISLSNKKKRISKSSKKLTYDIPLIDLCEKNVKNPKQGQEVSLTSGRSEMSDDNKIHLSADRTSTQNLSQKNVIDQSKCIQNRTKRPRILETPESHGGNLHADFTSASTQEATQNEIIDHSKKPKSFKRLRIGSEDSIDKENDGGKIDGSMGVESTPQSYSKNLLEDTPQTAARDGRQKQNAPDFLTDTPIVNTLKNIAEDIVCEFCASANSTYTNPLILCDGCNLGFHKECYGIKVDIQSEELWYCKSCIASKKNSDQSTSPQPKKLYKKSAKGSSKHSKSISWNTNATAVGERIHLADIEEESPRTKKQRLRERRRQGLAKFVLDEAEMGSDQERDDADEEEELRRIEEEEGAYSQDSFINDNAVLTQHFSQDILGEIDPDASPLSESGTPGIDPNSHRALDAQRERENHFKTPNFNRRMMRPSTQDTPSSAQGLGNMNFIRSVLEHHRNGGDCNQIETEFKRIEASSAEDQRNDPLVAATPTNIARNPNRDNEHIDLTTSPVEKDSKNNGNSGGTSNTGGIERQRPQPQQQPQQSGGLTADQLARIEANRQAALRRRAELLAKKQQPQNPR